MDSVAVRRYLEGTGAERCDPCGNDSGLYQQGREGTEKPREGHADANHRACVDKRRSGRYDGLATGVQQLPELVPFDCLLCGADLRFLP